MFALRACHLTAARVRLRHGVLVAAARYEYACQRVNAKMMDTLFGVYARKDMMFDAARLLPMIIHLFFVIFALTGAAFSLAATTLIKHISPFSPRR